MTGGERFACGDELTFPADALDGPVGAEHADHPAAAALRAHVSAERQEGFLPESGYRLVAQSPSAVLFLAPSAGQEGWASVRVERDGGGWSVTGWGGCQPMRAFEGAGVGTWQLDPAAPRPGPDATELAVLVMERACASGQSSAGRIVGPQVTETPDSVIVVFAVRPHKTDGAVACTGNPPEPATVQLLEPLGNRTLLDGAFQPPRPPAAP